MLSLPLTHAVAISILLWMAGMFLTLLVAKRYPGFSWGKFALFMSAPTLAVFVFSHYFGEQIFYIYLVSALVGFSTEFLLGFTFAKAMQTPLWQYHKDLFTVGRHTSFLTLPMWGNAGIIFWIVAEYVRSFSLA